MNLKEELYSNARIGIAVEGKAYSMEEYDEVKAAFKAAKTEKQFKKLLSQFIEEGLGPAISHADPMDVCINEVTP